MPTLHDIRRRIATSGNIQQITRAMKLVAAAKLRRYQDRMLRLRDYTEQLQALLKRFLEDSLGHEHPLLETRKGDRCALIVMSGDRGLCGSFNTNAVRHAMEFVDNAPGPVTIYSVGKRGCDYFRRRKLDVAADYAGLYDKPSFLVADQLIRRVIDAYTEDRFDEIHISRPRFVNTMTQSFFVERLLPFELQETAGEDADRRDNVVYLTEPSPEAMGAVLLGRSLAVQMHRAILESACCEFAARMVAMDLATENAEDMIQQLTLQYNRARQNSITKEILDIIGGAEVVE